ncbi:MAG: hypothetical protein EP343_12360 [Deltaproteobacteria bacterium]|nr:MAG: hypothetical protein EP343_12360 [Deltaproteobacteria bacterium]
MNDWIPQTKPTADIESLELSQEERFLFSKINGKLSIRNLSKIAGMSLEHVAETLLYLIHEGTIVLDTVPPEWKYYAFQTEGHQEETESEEPPSPPASDREVVHDPVEEPKGDIAENEETALESKADAVEEVTREEIRREEITREETEEPYETLAEETEEPSEDLAEEAEEALEEEDVSPKNQKDWERSLNFREVYAKNIRPLPPAQRAARAQTADANYLMAFCFDPLPEVIRYVLENVNLGLPHARLIAANHRSAAGLEQLCRNRAFLRDTGVQRGLFKNPQVPNNILQRVIQMKPLLQVYNMTNSHEMTQRVKGIIRELFRGKFQTSTAEEKVGLILNTDGRCLRRLVGVGLGDQVVTLLCRRAINSTMLLRNLANFPATPPRLLIHLHKQPMVRRNASLQNAILRHPNTPATLKT